MEAARGGVDHTSLDIVEIYVELRDIVSQPGCSYRPHVINTPP